MDGMRGKDRDGYREITGEKITYGPFPLHGVGTARLNSEWRIVPGVWEYIFGISSIEAPRELR